MFKNSQKIAINKSLLISLLFVILLFTSFGVSVEDSYASDLNESADVIKSDLNFEDKLENSQEEMVNTNLENDDVVGVAQDHEVLGKVTRVTGNKFSDIRNAIENAESGDTLVLSGIYYSERKYDKLAVDKKITFTARSMATLDGKNQAYMFVIGSGGAGTSFNNIKFINGYHDGLSAALRIETSNVTVTNCIFKDNVALSGSAICTTHDSYTAANLRIANCQFINNHAIRSAGALQANGNNTRITNCIFDSNSAYNDRNDMTPFGGAIQVGMDANSTKVYVTDCIFKNNHVDSESLSAHGGAGCVRDGTVYQNCIFINNSASQGGALTYHASGLIKNCTFIDNHARYYGGALSTGYLYLQMDLNIEDSYFEGNSAPVGGAIQLNGKNIAIRGCELNDNNASDYGGAICINAETVDIANSQFNSNIANINGGAVYINGTNSSIMNSSFISNDAIPDANKLDDGLGGAVYINSTHAAVKNSKFDYNTARNGSAIYYDKYGIDLKLANNSFHENQAWVYALPIYAEDIYYGQTENIGSIIHGGNNIARYGSLDVSNAIYNAANPNFIEIDGETPILGATNNGHLYQDDREYNMDVLMTVKYEDGTVVYNKTLNSDCFGEVTDGLENLKVGRYYVTAKHFEDTYYKAITNATTFKVTAQVDDKVRKSFSPEVINYDDIVIWTLNITNNGPCNATNIVISDILPEGLIWLDDNTNGDYNPETGVLTIDFLEVGEIYIVTIKTQIKKTGEIVNDVNVTADQHDYNLTNNHDQSKINVSSACDLAIEKFSNVSAANISDLIEWTITVTNNGPDDATGVIVEDLLPKSLIWDSDDGHGSYNHDSGVWNVGELANGTSARLTIVCRVNATGIIENLASVHGQQYDWNESNNHAGDKINVDPACDLDIVKSVNVSVVNYLDVVRWTIVVSNNGPDNASGVEVYDALPDGFVYVDSTMPVVDGVVSIGDLAVGESVSVDIVTWVNGTGNFTNVASVDGSEFDQDLSNNEDNASIFVKPATDLAVTKEVNASDVNLTDLITWTITVTNNGPDVANNVTVVDLLPESLVWDSDSGLGSYNHVSGVWSVGELGNGASARLTIICRVNATGVIRNLVSVSGNEFDWNKSNNNDSKVVNVNPACDLDIVKSVNVSVVNYLDVVRWTIVVFNNGPDNASGVEVYDALPEGFVYVDSTMPVVDGVISIGDLAVGESVSVDIVTWVNVTGNFTNVASVDGSEFDQDLSNNEDYASIFVKPATDLAVTKEVNASKPNFGDLITWTITVINNGPDVANNVTVVDLLPESLVWDSDSSLGSYNHVSGVWSVGELGNGASARLTIVCRVNATGEFINNVSVSGNEFDWNESNNKDNKTINVANASDLKVLKFANQSFVEYRQVIKWTVIAINNGPDKATGVFVEDILPDGLKVIGYSATKGFYDDGIWSVCCLENGENQTLELICEVNMTGTLTNTVKINGSEYDPDLSNNQANANVLVPKSSDLAVTKTVDNSNPDYGDIVEWTIVVRNNGPDDSEDILVVDILPEGLELLEYDCSNGSYYEGYWQIDYLGRGDSEYLVLRCLVKSLDDIENIVKVIPSQYDWNESNNNDSEKISINPVADMSIIKFVNVSQANYLDLVKWTLIAKNNGPNDATNVFVRDVIPKGFEITKVIGGKYENSIWEIGDLPNGESRELNIVCKVVTTGHLTNSAYVWADETDPDLENNEFEDYLYVPQASDISVTKTVSKYKYSPGDIIKYSIKITNNGPDRARNIEVKEIMDDSLSLKSFKVSAGEFDKVNDVWSLDVLDVAKSAFLKINAMAKKPGVVSNKVVAKSDSFDPYLKNNKDAVKVKVSKVHLPQKIKKEHKYCAKKELKEYSNSILQKYESGNPIMVFVLLFVFTMGALYGNTISKKR